MNFKQYLTNFTTLKGLQSFSKNQHGVAAVEFVLVFPLLIALLFGAVELYGHLNAIRKTGNLTASLADLVSQSKEITSGQLDALHPLAVSLMAPLDPSSIRYRIASVYQGDIGDDPQLRWEHINGSKNGSGKIMVGGDEYKVTECDKFDNNLNKTFPPNQSSVFVVVEYTYTSSLSALTGGKRNYVDNMIAIPRASAKVTLTDKSECSVAD